MMSGYCLSTFAGVRLLALAISGSVFAVPQVRSAQLVANFLDGAGEGFNDGSLGAARRNAFEYALGLWSAVLGGRYAGEQVVVDAVFNPLGGTATSATLAKASPNGDVYFTGSGAPEILFPAALGNHLAMTDVGGGASEIVSFFNSDVDGNAVLENFTFYYGTDNSGDPNTIDFVETALHEIGHGLGWSGKFITDSTDGNYGGYTTDGHATLNGYVSSYDFFVIRASDGEQLKGLTKAERIAALVGNDLAWGGARGTAANEDSNPALYAPNPVVPGSSYAHLDEGTFPTELMSPQSTPGTGHDLSPLTLAILADQGWTIIPEPTAGAMLMAALAFGLAARRRRLV